MKKFFNNKNTGLVLLLLVALFLLLFKIGKPFWGHHDWNGAFWGSITRNYLANIQKFLRNPDWENIDNVYRGEFIFFSHYTPLMPVLFTLSSTIFGFSEISLRLTTVIFSIVMLVFIYKIGKTLYSRRIGLIAVVLTFLTPMFQYFGRLPDHEPILTPFITITFYFYIKLKYKASKNYILFFIFLLLTLLESWGGFFFLALLFIHAFFTKRRKAFLFSLLLMGCLVVLLHLSLIYFIQGPDFVTTFVNHGLIRMDFGRAKSGVVNFSLLQFAEKEARYMVIYYTRILLLLSFIWIIGLISKRFKNSRSDIVLSMLFFTGISFILVFRNLAFIHDYKLYLLLPFMALTGAKMLDLIVIKISKLINKKRSSEVIIQSSIIALVVFLLALERNSYLKTLIYSSFDRPGYDFGKLVNKKTKANDKIFLNSNEFSSFYNVFFSFYANRKIDFGDLTQEEFEKKKDELSKYRYIALVKNRPVDEKLKSYLLDIHQTEEFGDYIFVDINKKRIIKTSCGGG